MSSILRREGWRGCFRGLQAALIIVPLHWSIYFSAYEGAKHWLGPLLPADADSDGSPQTLARAALASGSAAVAAAILTDTITNPLWVVRTRLMTQHAHQAAGTLAGPLLHSTWGSLRSIASQEGWPALYRGLRASWLASTHVFVQFPVYELLRRQMLDDRRRSRTAGAAASDTPQEATGANNDFDDQGQSEQATTASIARAAASVQPVPCPPTAGHAPDRLAWWELVWAASASKVAASCVSYPLELVRTRLQDVRQRPSGSAAVIDSTPALRSVVREILRLEGAPGLYAGFGANLIRVVPSCAATMLAYESIAHELGALGL